MSYDIDGALNRTAVTAVTGGLYPGTPTRTGADALLNQYSSAPDGTPLPQLRTHDARGQLTALAGSASRELRYDFAGRLVEARDLSLGVTTTWRTDVFGRRLAEEQDAGSGPVLVSTIAYDHWSRIEGRDASGALAWIPHRFDSMQTKSFDFVLATYEEDTPTTRAYKFDVDASNTGKWVEVPHGSLYRIKNDRLQCIIPAEGASDAEQARLLAFLRGLDPVQDEYVLELEFGLDEEGYFLQEPGHRHDGAAARLSSLTRQGVLRALEEMYGE